jgi:fructose-bisphosphate aldolase class I
MNEAALIDTANALLADDKGLLAMDESNPTCNRRFAALGIAQTEQTRRAWRDLIVTTPGLRDSISGAILYDETIRQKTQAGTPFAKALADAGIVPGIKVDAGAKDLAGHPGEKITEGLDGLRERLAEYASMGARFAKWRAVIAIGAGLPSRGCIEANAHALARYAALCQEAALVPIVEPEVLMDGDHSMARCSEVSQRVLRAVFEQLGVQRVLLEGVILKPAMVTPSAEHPQVVTPEAVADETVRCLRRSVPAAVPGIAFLSGGQAGSLASARLNAMNTRFRARLPWALTFSFARAIQQRAMEIWRGDAANVVPAQQALRHRAQCNRAARRGEYDAAMDAG